MISAEKLARKFHETYERLAPRFGWKSQCPVAWEDLPESNRRLMLATCLCLLPYVVGAKIEGSREAGKAWARIVDADACSWCGMPAVVHAGGLDHRCADCDSAISNAEADG